MFGWLFICEALCLKEGENIMTKSCLRKITLALLGLMLIWAVVISGCQEEARKAKGKKLPGGRSVERASLSPFSQSSNFASQREHMLL
jgi:hypothetical protein